VGTSAAAETVTNYRVAPSPASPLGAMPLSIRHSDENGSPGTDADADNIRRAWTASRSGSARHLVVGMDRTADDDERERLGARPEVPRPESPPPVSPPAFHAQLPVHRFHPNGRSDDAGDQTRSGQLVTSSRFVDMPDSSQ
jgi:hypothetical protein